MEPDNNHGEGHSGADNPPGGDAGEGKDNGVLKERVIHDEMIVHIIGFFLGDLSTLFEFEHNSRTVTDA